LKLYNNIKTIAFYTVIITNILLVIELTAIAYAVAQGKAWWDPDTICNGERSTGLTRINYAPVTVYGFANYRVELASTLIYEPVNIGGNVPSINRQWDTSQAVIFDNNIEVYFWETDKFLISWETYWLDFRTGSDYPQSLSMRVKDVSGYHWPSTTGTDTLTIQRCSGPLNIGEPN